MLIDIHLECAATHDKMWHADIGVCVCVCWCVGRGREFGLECMFMGRDRRWKVERCDGHFECLKVGL